MAERKEGATAPKRKQGQNEEQNQQQQNQQLQQNQDLAGHPQQHLHINW